MSIYQIQAEYIQQIIPSHRHNPLLEALPPILDEKQWVELLTKYPEVDKACLSLPAVYRIHLLDDIKRVYQPLRRSLSLAQDFDVMLRSGYVSRNPFNPLVRKGLNEKKDMDIRKYIDEADNDGVSTSGITIIGLSGVGKSRTINRILARYPQVIQHKNYQGKPFIQKQVLYLKFDCPPRGTLIGLAQNGIKQISQILGDDFRLSRLMSNQDGLLRAFLNLASEHYLGVLIIDEIQNLYGSKEGRLLLNYLIMISNDFNIPIVLIGTPEAENVLSKEFRMVRRGNGYGSYDQWDQMKKIDRDWNTFVNTIWQYQYLSEFTPLTPALKNIFYDLSGGIADLAIKLFIAVQKQAIYDDEKKLTIGLFKHVADNQFSWTKGAIQALRLDTPQARKKYNDLFFRNMRSNPTQEAENTIPEIDSQIRNDMPHSNAVQQTLPPQRTPKTDRKRTSKSSEKQGLLAKIVLEGRKNGQTAYQSLKNEGWIGNLNDII